MYVLFRYGNKLNVRYVTGCDFTNTKFIYVFSVQQERLYVYVRYSSYKTYIHTDKYIWYKAGHCQNNGFVRYGTLDCFLNTHCFYVPHRGLIVYIRLSRVWRFHSTSHNVTFLWICPI